jgi:hypothetical protein
MRPHDDDNAARRERIRPRWPEPFVKPGRTRTPKKQWLRKKRGRSR